MNSGNVFREIDDLEVWGGVGEHQLVWKRYSNSRAPGPFQWFGSAGNFRHAYQWEIPWNGQGDTFDVYDPDGGVTRFTRSTTVPNEWRGSPAITDIIFQSGSDFILQTQNGWRYHFELLSTTQGDNYMQLQDFKDSQGNAYTLTYDNQKRLSRITEPGGRFLQITWQSLPIVQVEFTTLQKITVIPPSTTWTELDVTDPTPFRYLRYLGPDGSHCIVGEVEFLASISGPPLSGTAFGTSPAIAPGMEFDKASDGDVATFFDYAVGSGGFTGLDLGAGNEQPVVKVRFYPRPGFEGIMVKGQFQGSNKTSPTISAIAQVTTSDGRSVTYNYQAISDATLPFQYQALVSAIYGDGTRAQYTWSQVFPSTRPLLASAKDPRYVGQAANMKYEYFDIIYAALGTIHREINGVDGVVMTTLGVGAGVGARPQVADANGAVIDFHYLKGQQVTQLDGLGRLSQYTYGANGFGFLESSTDPLGRTTQLENTAFGNWSKVTYPDGSSESWTRDDLELVLTHTDELGHTTSFTRDAQHRIVRIDHPDQTFELFTYNSFGQMLTHTMRNGGVEACSYDVRGLKTSCTNALGNVSQYSYDLADRLASTTDARGNTTQYEYDERGLLTKITHCDGSSRSYTYDEFGNKTSESNEIGNTWKYAHDEFKRLISTTDPLNRKHQYSYDLSGGVCGCTHTEAKPTQIILPSGKTNQITYDLEWQKIAETVGFGTPDEATTKYAYDAAGNLTRVTDPNTHAWTFTYDSRDRRATATDPIPNTTTWIYDFVGNVKTNTRPDLGQTIYNAYDPMNRLLQVTDPKAQVTQFTYDAEGNLKTLTDARGNTYTYDYDLLNRRTELKYPDLSKEVWSYDSVGNVSDYVTRAGQTKTCSYDCSNRETFFDWNDSTPDVAKTYDAASRLLILSNSVSLLTYTYDDANQLLTETQNISGAGGPKTLSYDYDLDGNRMNLTYPDGTKLDYDYTARNQLSTITADGPPPLVTYTYDLAGNRISKSLENGTTVGYAYDNANRMTLVDHQKASVSFARLDYAYDSVNRRKFVKRDNGKGDVFAYDAIDQVTGVQYAATNPDTFPSSPTRVVGYVYDKVGNRTSVAQNGAPTSYAANNLNQYTQVDGAVLAYDSNGNLKTRLLWTYTYDAQNRLITADNGQTAAAFAYDGRNRCVKRVINGVTTFLYFDDWSLIEERDGSDTLKAKYVHGALLDELLLRASDTDALHYYHHDSIGNVTHLTDVNGIVVEKYSYDIFGKATATQITPITVPNRFLFTGREYLSELSLYDYRNRFYWPGLGRFLQTDPIRFDARDVNLYRYLANNSINAVDPFGFQNEAEHYIGQEAIAAGAEAIAHRLGGNAAGAATSLANEGIKAAEAAGPVTEAVLVDQARKRWERALKASLACPDDRGLEAASNRAEAEFNRLSNIASERAARAHEEESDTPGWFVRSVNYLFVELPERWR